MEVRSGHAEVVRIISEERKRDRTKDKRNISEIQIRSPSGVRTGTREGTRNEGTGTSGTRTRTRTGTSGTRNENTNRNERNRNRIRTGTSGASSSRNSGAERTGTVAERCQNRGSDNYSQMGVKAARISTPISINPGRNCEAQRVYFQNPRILYMCL